METVVDRLNRNYFYKIFIFKELLFLSLYLLFICCKIKHGVLSNILASNLFLKEFRESDTYIFLMSALLVFRLIIQVETKYLNRYFVDVRTGLAGIKIQMLMWGTTKLILHNKSNNRYGSLSIDDSEDGSISAT